MVSGVVMLGLLFILRLLVGYGDPQAWQIFGDTGLTLMSVFNVTKYPFSLQFVLMTLSVAFFYLSITDGQLQQMKTSVIELIGNTPMFFYILHIYVLHGIALLVVIYKGMASGFVNNLGGIPKVWIIRWSCQAR